ncbi:MAG: hypothetical protein NTY25_00645 [Planctomycetia bacterium]|nr:hypothetical protein [Planctomycetia bacterium]
MAKSEGGRPTDRPQSIPGSILPDAIYRADEAKARMGWKDAAFRAACRRGLKVHRVGKRAYVTGADLAAFIMKGGAAS